MRRGHVASIGAIALVTSLTSFTAVSIDGQVPSSTSPGKASTASKTKTATKPKPWTLARTSWGDPDLQGIWNNGTITPLERPTAAGQKDFLSEEETGALNQEAASRAESDRRPTDKTADLELAYNAEWWDRGKSIGRTSLVVDPEDGRLPALTPEGQKKRDALMAIKKSRGAADSWEDRPYQERCILYHGVPPLPTGYNNNYHIVQTPGMVAILHEMLHEVRMIPLDGRPHIGKNIRLWMGDSRGHWEGDTLVVETTNYSSRIDTFKFPADSATLRIIEHFKRVSEDKIDYTWTVDNPTMYTRQWTATLPMTKDEGPIFEYACHEGNYGMRNVLSGYRAQEQAAEAAKKSQK
jgi:hypothetical protein